MAERRKSFVVLDADGNEVEMPDGYRVSQGGEVEVLPVWDKDGNVVMEEKLLPNGQPERDDDGNIVMVEKTQRVDQPPGVIVGPPEPWTEERTFFCTICNNKFTKKAESAICNGINLMVDPETFEVTQAAINTSEALDQAGIRAASHSPEPMEVVA